MSMNNKKQFEQQLIAKSSTRLKAGHGLLYLLAILVGQPVLAQQDSSVELHDRTTKQREDSGQSMTTVTVIGTRETENTQNIGNTTGASKEDIERRNASHMGDLIDSISGTSVNNLYSRPEISVGVQGVAGFGRVSQSLEGISQNFHSFTRDIGMTGSIFVDPQFLKSIDVTRGGSTGTGALGSLGNSVDFKYLDLEDILLPGKNFGGIVRGIDGFSQYANGQKPSGSFFLGGQTDRWDVMVGVSDRETDAYRIGSHFDEGDMLKYFHATNMEFAGGSGRNGRGRGDCRYNQVVGIDRSSGGRSGLVNCQLSAEGLKWLEQAAKSGALKGTEKETASQMLRVRHYFSDEYDQTLELFATASQAKYQSDQEPTIWVPEDGSDAYWHGLPWHIGNELDNSVISLKYQGAFSDLLNPEVQIYHESQDRKQRWKGLPGSLAPNEDMHYFVDNYSTGIKLSNASHFSVSKIGPLRLDAALELRRADKDVDSFSEEDWIKKEYEKKGLEHNTPKWDTDSRNMTQGVALDLSTDSGAPWQAHLGVGWQRVKMDAYSPRFQSGNVAKAGSFRGAGYWYKIYREQGYSSKEARQMAKAKAYEVKKEFYIGPDFGDVRFITDDQEHSFNLKSASFGLQYTRAGTGLTTYASVNYSERAPTSSEMYIAGAWNRVRFDANPHLQPEKALSLQLGAKYQGSAWLTQSDKLNAGVNYYQNRIRNYIGYGPIWTENSVVRENDVIPNTQANVNNLETVIHHGFELDLDYRQSLFYVRGNLTIPLRHDNKMCSYKSPSGINYYQTTDANGNTVFSPTGNGGRICYSGWNWMETSPIEPIRGSLTAALTPYGEKLEVGSTVHFRGRQRAAYYYLESVQQANPGEHSSGPLPDGEGWIEAYLWPRTIKLDLFANYRFNDRLKLGVYLANVTDEFDGTPTTFGYNFYPGRTLTANLEYRF